MDADAKHDLFLNLSRIDQSRIKKNRNDIEGNYEILKKNVSNLENCRFSRIYFNFNRPLEKRPSTYQKKRFNKKEQIILGPDIIQYILTVLLFAIN